MSNIRLIGDTANGIEIRYNSPERDWRDVDEIVCYHGGEVVLHLEQMSDTHFWMGIYSGGKSVHANVFAKNGRSTVLCSAENDSPTEDKR